MPFFSVQVESCLTEVRECPHPSVNSWEIQLATFSVYSTLEFHGELWLPTVLSHGLCASLASWLCITIGRAPGCSLALCAWSLRDSVEHGDKPRDARAFAVSVTFHNKESYSSATWAKTLWGWSGHAPFPSSRLMWCNVEFFPGLGKQRARNVTWLQEKYLGRLPWFPFMGTGLRAVATLKDVWVQKLNFTELNI